MQGSFYEAEIVCDVVDVKTFGVLLGQKWITRMGVRYNRRRKTFIYPWMKKASPQPEPSLQSVPEPKNIMEPESLPDPVVEPEPLLELEPVVESEPVVEPEPVVESEPEAVIEVEPVPEPEPDSEHDYMAESELVSDSLLEELEMDPDLVLELELDAELEPVTESDFPLTPPEEIKIPLLHEYLDPFLTEEPDPSSFQLNVEDSFCKAFTIFSTTDTIARPAAQGIHHQLLESRLYSLRGLNSRTSFFPPGENDGNQIVDWTNPIKLSIL